MSWTHFQTLCVPLLHVPQLPVDTRLVVVPGKSLTLPISRPPIPPDQSRNITRWIGGTLSTTEPVIEIFFVSKGLQVIVDCFNPGFELPVDPFRVIVPDVFVKYLGT